MSFCNGAWFRKKVGGTDSESWNPIDIFLAVTLDYFGTYILNISFSLLIDFQHKNVFHNCMCSVIQTLSVLGVRTDFER